MAFQFPEFAILGLAVMVSMLTGGIDLSVIGLANLSSMLAVLVMRSLAPDPHAAQAAPAIALGLAALLGVGAVGGLLNGLAIAAIGIPPILATLGTGLIFTGIAVVLSGGAAVLGFPDAISVLGNGTLVGVPAPVLLFAALAAAVAFGLNWTGFGLRVYLLGTNPLAARFAGIDNFRVTLGAYLISGLLSSLAGLVIAVRANSAKADYGSSYLLLSILIAVLGGVDPYGGFGKVSGLVLAVLSLQFLSSGLNLLQVSNFAVDMTWGALLLLVMVVNTGGWRRLFAARPRRQGLEEEPMKKLINRPENFVAEMLDGLVKAHPDQLAFAGEPVAIVRADAPVQGKVALATGGGSGHLPVFLGYVGRGLLDGCAVGDVFNSPSSETMLDVTRRIHGGKGVVYIYGNYGGDVMNFDMASEMAAMEDIEVRTVLVRDDVASAPPAEAARRRGVAGMVFAFKVAGAKADLGGSLEEVAGAAEHALANLRTMGVALSPCTVPRVGKPTFTIGEGEMEIGMGIHGEPGAKREALATADEVAGRMAEAILADLGAAGGDRVAVMVNGLGATPAEELYILYRRVHDLLAGRRISVHRAYVGEYATSMEMAGASLTIFRLDDELARLLDAPARSPFFCQV